jgi:hypothetical protein
VFDVMLSSGMMESKNKRIEFPDKHPIEWKMFQKCIDPSEFLCSHLRVKVSVTAMIVMFESMTFHQLKHIRSVDQDLQLWTNLMPWLLSLDSIGCKWMLI